MDQVIDIVNVMEDRQRLAPNVEIKWTIGVIADMTQVTYQLEELPSAQMFESIVSEALAGDGSALFTIGTMFEFGAVFLKDLSLARVLTVSADSKVARDLFVAAEATGHKEASFRLGLMAHHGIVQPADQQLAAWHFERGAENGHPTCYRMLGIYATFASDLELARHCFLLGARLDDPICCFNTALEIEKGNLLGYTLHDSIVFAGRAADQLPEDDEIQNFFKRLSSSH